MGEQIEDTTLRDVARPTDEEIRSALRRVTSQAPFAQSHRLSKFLSYIVEETLAGRSEKIGGYAVGLDVFEKPEDFDPRIDTNVRVEASRMRRRLGDYYRDAGVEDPVEIIVPKGSYVPEFKYRSGQLACAPAAPSDAPRPQDHRPSIAVLPFNTHSSKFDDQFFADGLTEETIANLARFKELSVFSRTTSSKLVREGLDVRQVHKELGADFVVEGSVRKSERLVRVTVQLIDAAADVHVLSEKFERPCTPDGVFEIQDEIALLVAGRIAGHHGPIGRYISRARRTGKSQQWETYYWIHRFYAYYAIHSPEQHQEVRDGLAEAIEKDEDASDALAAMAILLLDEYRFHMNERPGFDALELGFAHALRAATSDPDSAFAYHALAMAYFHRREFSEFQASAERALSLNPGHADMLADLGTCYCGLGDWDRGLALIDRAIDLSPVHPGWYQLMPACRHALDGEFEDAVDELRSSPLPGMYWYHACLSWFLAELDQDAARAEEMRALEAVFPDFAEHAKRECQIWCLHDELEEGLIAGLRKAGVNVA